MYKSSKNHIHLIGIGGIGMSGLAELLLSTGYKVSGSDISDSESVKKLKSLGADIKIGHRSENLKNSHGDFCDVVVRSSAIDSTNPEILAAIKARVRVIRRAELLADLMHMKFGIAVAGTHGKTTTSSLVASTFIHAGMDPTVVIGGKVANIGGNAKLGKGKFIIAEADESDGSFLLLSPAILVVTNIDDDHLDHYGNFEGIKSAFLQFIEKTPFYGQAILCEDDPVVRELLPSIRAPHTTYGFSETSDWKADNLHSEICAGVMGTSFNVYWQGKNLGEVFIPCSGRHNVLNALATIAVSAEAEIPVDLIFAGLQKFEGVQRRFEKKGEVSGVTVFDDYAHHPTEISCTLSALRDAYPDKKLIACFQPHRYSRTRDCMERFSKVFDLVDHLILTDIYPASEAPIPGITIETLRGAIDLHFKSEKIKTEIEIRKSLEEMSQRAAEVASSSDIIICLGAGSITRSCEMILKRLG